MSILAGPWVDAPERQPVAACPRHLFVEMTRRNGNVVALCNACRERIEVPIMEFDQLFAQGLAVGKVVRL